MRVCAVMMFYSEPMVELGMQVRALAGLADRLVACDGRWEGFGEGSAVSRLEEVDVILSAARRMGLDLTLHRPAECWAGEVAHRSYALELAKMDADWIFLVDADERVKHFAPDTREKIEQTELDVCTVQFHTLDGPHQPATTWEERGGITEQRRFFRNQPDLSYGRHHWHLRTLTQALWGEIDGFDLAPACALDVDVEHRTAVRSDERWATKRAYISVRDPADLARGWEL